MSQAPGQAPAPRPRSARELAARLACERGGQPFLLYRNAQDEQLIVVLEPERTHLTLGRDPANDIALGWDQEISRAHAELERLAGHWTVTDDGLSRNGTFVNGTRVQGRRRLRDGDCLRLGQTVIVFSVPLAQTGGATVAAARTGPAVEDLTPTQRRVLAALCRPLVLAGGLAPPASNREIAEAVNLSIEGVKGQLRTLSERFGVAELPQNSKRLELAQRALQAGLGAPASD